MLVSFYTQVSIIAMSFLLILLPFLGLPQSFDKALIAILGALILGISVQALYGGYVRILKREERRTEQHREKKSEHKAVVLAEEEAHSTPHGEDSEFKNNDYNVLRIVRD